MQDQHRGTGAQAQAADRQEPAILVERPQDGIAVVTLNRPGARNALSLEVLKGLREIFSQLASDDAVRAIILAANGPAFCAGHDLKELTAHRGQADGGKAFYSETMTTCSELMQGMVACPKPIIAAVHAMATAAGCQLVATCDLAIAAQGAKFCTPGVNIGLFCSTPMVALSRNVPRKRAMEMLLLGEIIDAQTAADYGLVNRVVPAERLMDEAMGFARRIADKSAATVRIGKEAFYRQIEQPLGEAYDYAAAIMVENMLYRDAEEGIGAFIEKRNPEWKGC
ncbi:MAG: enoyl-CoA hydratase [Alphaproteobacteria bacterium BRH_c36]|nr:MAG: enoyl-CoA hydratase [Alphaproteobacteria bacterium BRH_c36]